MTTTRRGVPSTRACWRSRRSWRPAGSVTSVAVGAPNWRRWTPPGFTDEQRAEWLFQRGWEAFKLDRPEEAESLFAASAELAPGRGDYFLGVAQLRVGERDNCIGYHNAESCVFPLAGGGVHVEKNGADRAEATFRELVDRAPLPFRPQVRWFLNLAAMARGEWPGDLPPHSASIRRCSTPSRTSGGSGTWRWT